jgi:hypothetical protein
MKKTMALSILSMAISFSAMAKVEPMLVSTSIYSTTVLTKTTNIPANVLLNETVCFVGTYQDVKELLTIALENHTRGGYEKVVIAKTDSYNQISWFAKKIEGTGTTYDMGGTMVPCRTKR